MKSDNNSGPVNKRQSDPLTEELTMGLEDSIGDLLIKSSKRQESKNTHRTAGIRNDGKQNNNETTSCMTVVPKQRKGFQLNDNQAHPTAAVLMSGAEFLNKRTNCPEDPDNAATRTSDKTRSDHKQNNFGKSNNNEADVKAEPTNPNENASYSPEQHDMTSHGDVHLIDTHSNPPDPGSKSSADGVKTTVAAETHSAKPNVRRSKRIQGAPHKLADFVVKINRLTVQHLRELSSLRTNRKQCPGGEAKEATFKSSESLRTIEGKKEDINGLMEKLQCLHKQSEDIKGSNADNSNGSHQRISSQLSDSAQSLKFTMPRRLPLQRCIYCKITYRDPRHVQRHFTYYKCLKVLFRDTFTTYKAAQKHQQEHPGHVCVMKTSTEPRALTRSRIHIPLVSQPRIRMVRVLTTSTVTLPTSTALQADLRDHQYSSQNPNNMTQVQPLPRSPNPNRS